MENIRRSDLTARVVPMPGTARRSDDGLVDLGDLPKILMRRWRIMTVVAVVVVAAAVAYALLATSLYTATAQIYFDPRDHQVVSNDLTSTAMAPDGGLAQVESQLKIISSDEVLMRAVRAMNLSSDKEFVKRSLLSEVLDALRSIGLLNSRPTAEDPELAALRTLRKRVSLQRGDKAYVIELDVTANDPEKAARIANAITAAYLADQAMARADAANEASRSLRARLGELQDAVRVAENAVQVYKEAHDIVNASGLLVNEQQLIEINNQFVDARARASQAESRLDQIEALRRSNGDLGTLAEAIGSPVISQLRAQQAELTRRNADLEATYGARHPLMVNIRAQIADVARAINDELGRIAQAARNEYERAVANEAALQQALETSQTGNLSDSQASVELRELEREAEAARAVYEAFLVRARETHELASIDTTNARVITAATPPSSASWPPRFLLLMASVMCGVGFGAGAAFLRECAAPLVQSPRQLSQAIRAPIIATLRTSSTFPMLKIPARRPPNVRDLNLAARRILLSSGAAGDELNCSLMIVAAASPERALVAALADAIGAARPAVSILSAEEAIAEAEVAAAAEGNIVSVIRDEGRTRKRLSDLRPQNQLVVATAQNALEHEPSQSLATAVDHVVMVVAGGTEVSRVSDLAELLRLSGAHVLGAIFADEV